MKWLTALPGELLRAAVMMTAFGSLLLAALAFAGAVHPGFGLFANLAPAGLGSALLAGLVWLILPSPRAPASAGPLALIALVLWGALVGPDFAARFTARKVPATGETLKVVQMNLWAQDWTHNEVKRAWIRKENPDALLLEEVGPASVALTASLAKDYPYAYGCQGINSACSVMLLSKRKATAVGGAGYAWSAADVVWARFAGAGGDYVLAAAHTTWPMPDGRQDKELAQFALTLRTMKADTIAAGDFNATPWSFPLRRFDAASGLIRRTHALPTFPAGQVTSQRLPTFGPILPIDHVYSSPGWGLVSVERGPDLGSDHFPLVATFARAAPKPGK
jgi:endonuclease/exonuclease/phosphatase (EEP) superfamily protein YafD